MFKSTIRKVKRSTSICMNDLLHLYHYNAPRSLTKSFWMGPYCLHNTFLIQILLTFSL